jgi:dTDP-4-amino-4,6-dideoxygalactose transaminase
MNYNQEYIIDWCPQKNIDTIKINNLLAVNITSRKFTNYGPNIYKLEQTLRNLLEIDDNKSIIVVTNATVGLDIMTTGIEYYHKNKINWATQSFTFPSSIQGNLRNCKVLDIDTDGGLNLDYIDEIINGIIVTNIFGNVVNISKYIEYANKFKKYLIFDNAATPYTYYKNKNALNYGIGSIISLHHTKPIGFGEGGAIIIDKIYEKTIRSLINFGMNLNENSHYLREGNNFKMSEIAAVYILQYLDNFNYILEKHYLLYNYFKKNIINCNYKLFPSYHDDKILIACFAILFDNYTENIKINLEKNKIFSRKYYYPLDKTLIAENIYNKILCIPCTIDMSIEDIDKIIKILNESC